MAHNLLRLTTQVLNSPQLITQAAFDPIVNYLRKRSLADFEMPIKKTPKKKCDDGEDMPMEAPEEEGIEVIGGIAIIEVEGPLTFKPQQMLCAPETTSYESILEQTQEAIDQGCNTIVYEHSSCGGQAFFCFEAANEIRKMLSDNGVKSIAYILEGSASASYALACVCDEIIINPGAECGSIGCVVVLSDHSKENEMEGVKPIYISFPVNKVPFAEDGSFKKSFLDKLTEDVTRLGTQFAEHVSSYTGLSVETIIGLDGQMFYAEKALEIGLVNKIMSYSDFITYLTSNRSN